MSGGDTIASCSIWMLAGGGYHFKTKYWRNQAAGARRSAWKIPNTQNIQNIQNMNYGNLISNKIKFCNVRFLGNFVVCKCIFELLVSFVS